MPMQAIDGGDQESTDLFRRVCDDAAAFRKLRRQIKRAQNELNNNKQYPTYRALESALKTIDDALKG